MKKLILISSLCALALSSVSTRMKNSETTSARASSDRENSVEAIPESNSSVTAESPQKTIAQSEAVTLKDQALQIENLSQIVFYTDAKKKAMKALLANPKMRAEIAHSLNDASNYSGSGLQQKLRFLDVLYEGLKFPEAKVSQPYFDLAQNLLSESVPESFGSSKDLRREFIADRTEIAMALMRAFPDQAKSMETAVAQKSAEGTASFKNARRLKGLYEVAL